LDSHVPDFNQLVVISEMERKPVIAIDDNILLKHKINTPYYKKR